MQLDPTVFAAETGGLLLQGHWAADMEALGAAASADAAFADILARHGEPHRRYHGLAHLLALFRLLESHAPQIPPGAPARVAVWWHDAIYDPAARDNEERSAALAREHLTQLGADPAVIDGTCRIILATKDHFAPGSYREGDCFLDADIAILGAAPDVYDRYADDVREEYAWAPDDLYRAGRSAFLAKALGRSRLFRTDAFEAAYGDQARRNMQRELHALERPPSS